MRSAAVLRSDLFNDIPAAISSGVGAIFAVPGIVQRLDAATALESLGRKPHLVCHASFLIERLGHAAGAPRARIRQALEQKHLDVAELFAFVCPARFATPTPEGVARALGLPPGNEPVALLPLIVDD